ncbi:MAG TPA: hypothetical protein VKU82_05590 [Planctomycetaceae bacterium]|nr:hypothetical protein [Planctomycetaceae bacterium]
MKTIASVGVVIVGILAAAALRDVPASGQEAAGRRPRTPEPGARLGLSPTAEVPNPAVANQPFSPYPQDAQYGHVSPEAVRATQELMRQDAELEQQIRQTVHEYAAADSDDERGEARKKLSGLLKDQFSIRQKRREQDIARIEERVKRLREALKKRSESQQEIVERRLNDILSDADGLGWGDAAGDAGANPYLRDLQGIKGY